MATDSDDELEAALEACMEREPSLPAEQTVQEIEHLLNETNLNTLLLVRKDKSFLGIFSQNEAFSSKSKEEILATS